MDFLTPKAYLIPSDSLHEPWIVLRPKDELNRAPRRMLSTLSLLAIGILAFGVALPLSAYNLLSSRSAAALLATAHESATNSATFTLPGKPKISSPAPGLAGATGAIGETGFQPAISAASTNPVLRIERLGIVMPIVEGEGESALYRGAWRSPWGSEPGQGGKTVLFGHRWLHLPPNPNTMFRLDELQVGETIEVDWQGKTYTYIVQESLIVDPADISVLNQTNGQTLTLITCTPKFTTQQRLVIHATRQ